MLMEERLDKILRIVEERKRVTVQELTEALSISESTIRRDLTLLDKDGRLNKVHGGATAVGMYRIKDEEFSLRKKQNKEEKIQIARYAANLVGPNDFVYLDAGTTTALMVDFLTEKNAVFVTNAINHARRLVEAGVKTHILGGEFKLVTEAIVGMETVLELEKYNFTMGFFGTNGISRKTGYSTPDINEAMVKKKAMEQCKECYVLADSHKFGRTSLVSFSAFDEAAVITTKVKTEEFIGCSNILEIGKA